MKKILTVVLLTLSLLLAGCANEETEVVIIDPQGQSRPADEKENEAPAEGEENKAQPENAEEGPAEERLMWHIDPADEYDNYGYSHFLCEQAGLYSFEPIGSEELGWTVYIMAEEFPDAERYIPQVYEASLEGAGQLQVEEGQFIYVYCLANGWTGLEIPENSGMDIKYLG